MAVPLSVIHDFVKVKRFAVWLHSELSIGRLMLQDTDNDGPAVMLQLRLAISSPRPHEVADILHNHVWPHTVEALEPRVLSICSCSSTVACFFEDPEDELHIDLL